MTVGRSSSPTHQQGEHAEQRALSFLMAQGLQLIGQNVHNRYGEWDLILMHDQTVVFVEVRFRKSLAFGGAAASITHAKRRKLIASAEQFLQDFPAYQPFDCRFDVVIWQGHDCAEPEWICAAFGSD